MSKETLQSLIKYEAVDTSTAHGYAYDAEAAIVAKIAKHFHLKIHSAEKNSNGDILGEFGDSERYFLKEYLGVDEYQGIPVRKKTSPFDKGGTFIDKDTFLISATSLDASLRSALINYGFDDAYSHVTDGKLKAGDSNSSDLNSIDQHASMLWILESLGYKQPVWLRLGAGDINVTEFESFNAALKYVQNLEAPSNVGRRVGAMYSVGKFGLNIVAKTDKTLPKEVKVKTREQFEQQLKVFDIKPKPISVDMD